MNRRNFLMSSAAGAAFLLPLARAALASNAEINDWFGADGAAFSFERLTDLARQRAGRQFVEPDTDLPERLASLTYDQHRAIRYRPDHAVWHGKAPFELQAFHMGWLFKAPVGMFEVDGGKSRPLAFKPADFEYRAPLDPASFADIQMPGVAGFRVHNALNRPDIMDELAVFLGASYFRVLGRGNVYGLSARGLAVNTATQDGEEFPRFDAFFIETPSPDAEAVTIYASLDSRSVTGAYAFRIVPGEETTMEVTARIFLRADVERLGVAPMTSMFLFGENNRSAFRDYRNAVHDSDGLKIVRRGGEEVWRNLNNPARLATSFFNEESPRAFGLLQRDRAFDNYQDAGAAYERRPSLLVEPIGDWGRGAITLVEIPTELEVNDNIVAFWVPEGEVKAGQNFEYRYKLTWGALEDAGDKLARVVALRGGHGGVSGVENDADLQKFVVDFAGGALAAVAADSEEIESTLKASNAEIVHSSLSRIEANGAWRLVLDVRPEGDSPAEFSAFLSHRGTRISETWVYQWRPQDDRRS
ncbi:MAG: glucan biosynthesis protein G [Brucellaceae bacterium]|nr:glucan biosynthesis protein G [Brucellaceae bacterium]